MKGAIIVNGYYTGASYSHQAKRIGEEFRKLGVDISIYENSAPIAIGSHFDINFAVFLDKDTALARVMEQDGVAVFNSSFSIETADSKIKTALILSSYKDIKMPKTIPSPKQYKYSIDEEYLRDVGKSLGFPLVVKTAYGSLGNGVYLAKNIEELFVIDAKIGNADKLYQEFISASEGKSIRIMTVGNKAVSCMLLTNEKDFRSNASLGGEARSIVPAEEYVVAAENISRYLDLDYCGVDFFVNSPIVIEVNSNAFFKKTEEITKVNIAKIYAEYIYNTIKEITHE